MTETTLDVSELEPCEPLERTLDSVGVLTPGHTLRVIHRRDPKLLYPLLQEMGFAWYCREGGPSRFEIFVWKRGDSIAQASVAERVGRPFGVDGRAEDGPA